MAETPAVHGKKFMGLSKNEAIIVAIGGAGVVFLVFRHYRSASAAVSSTDAAATQDIDPETGYAYGSAQDVAALGTLNSSGTATDSGGAATDSEPYYSTVPTTQIPTTNSAWSQYVQQQLATIGYDPETVAGAIGAYLGEIALTPTQVGIVQVALAECGPPPQGEYSIIPVGTSTPVTGTTTTTTGTTTTASTSAGPISNLQPSKQTSTSVTMAWNKAAGATGGYAWNLKGTPSKSGKTTATSVTVSGLKKGKYVFSVQGLPGGFGDNYTVTIT